MRIQKKEIRVRPLPDAGGVSVQTRTMLFYIPDEGHTLASALRTALESEVDAEQYVSCTIPHPLDTYIEVNAPSEQSVRRALLTVREQISRQRALWQSGPTESARPA